jgi:hypothetical protein
VAAEFSIAQQYGFYGKEPAVDKLTNHADIVARANRIRKKKGLPPVPDTMPGDPVVKTETGDGGTNRNT